MFRTLFITLSLTVAFGANGFAATAIYRSAAPSADTALVTGTSPSITLTISGTAAAFSLDIPDSVGVGDAIQYDSDNNGSIDAICFIHGRTDAQHYTVKNAAGGTPTATSTADTDWAIYRSYASLQDAINGYENASIDDAVEDFDPWDGGKDIASSNEQWNIACYANGTTADAQATIGGWTTDSDNYVRIYTPSASSEVGVSQRHSGTWDDSKYHMETDDDVFQIYNSYVKVDGLQLRIIDTSPWVEGFRVNNAGYVWISNNIVKGAGPDSRWAVEIQDGATGKIYVWNNICYKVANGINDYSGSGVKVYAYNNTFVNCRDVGIATGSTSNMVAKNNIVQDCPVGYSGTFDGASDYNISDLTDAPGSHSKQSTTVSFINASGYDFHLAPADAPAINSGANLTNDSELPFSSDIDGNGRLSSGDWDIGADETITFIYRSVGVGATSPLASGGSNALTISGSTATFNSDLPSNVGVGDALQYDSDNGGTIDAICFIHGRTDARHYTVKNAAGGPPTATSSSDNDWALYRAYTSLNDATHGSENSFLDDTIENFDTWSNGKDLASSNEQWNIACYANGTTADTNAEYGYASPWVTTAQHYIRIYTPTASSEVGVSQRHQGKWDTTKYKIEATNYPVIWSLVDFVRIEGLQVQLTGTSGGYHSGVNLYSENANSDVRVSDCIIKGVLSGTALTIGIQAYGTVTVKVWNNIVYDFTNGTTEALGIYVQGGATLYAYNNTFYNCYGGLWTDGTFIAKNNIVKGSGATTAYAGNFAAGTDYNATDGTDDIGQGTHNKISQAFAFLDEPNDNFHLIGSDTAARLAGKDLSQDAALAFANDIDGQTRSPNKWDIGADQQSQATTIGSATIRNATIQ